MTNGTQRYLETVEWLGKLYDYVNDQLFNSELVRPVITVQTDVKNRYYGWFTLRKVWKENEQDDGEYEINMSAQHLNRPVQEIASTLIHEMCHHYAKVNNMQDCSRSGTYHNKLFKKIAETHGLNVECVQTIGWSQTSLTDDTKELLDIFLQYHPANMIYRTPPVKGGRVKTSSTRKYICACCGMSVRATRSVNIMCADCNEFMCEV
ncbi:MAG: SprT-like domain-containing protein [Clostridia bacterium]|nr:SprT-like domain-containing protein [Clostridia bacterium]